MPVYKMIFNVIDDTVVLYHHGCNYSCSICSYGLREGIEPRRFFDISAIEEYISGADPAKVVLQGGEPTIWKDIARVTRFCKIDISAHIKIPHTNGSVLPPDDVDEVCISLPAISKRRFHQLTGAQNTRVMSNIFKLHDRGTTLAFSTVLIPDFTGLDEIDKVAAFISEIDDDIPLHISSYLPVPGMGWRRPTRQEMYEAYDLAKQHLRNVTATYLSAIDFLRVRPYYPHEVDIKVA